MQAKIKMLRLAVGCAVLGLGATTANAALIAAFDSQTSGGFIDGTATCSNAPGTCGLEFANPDPNEVATQYQKLSWGTPSTSSGNPNEKSFIEATHYNTTIITNGGWFTVDQFDHVNHVLLADGGSMETVQYDSRFVLTNPANPLNFPGLAGSQTINFDETLNQQLCPGLNPLGTHCDDVFNIMPLTGSFEFLNDGEYRYFLSFQFVAGPGAFVDGPLDDGGHFGAEDGTYDIYTSEACSANSDFEICDSGYQAGVSTIFIQARIDARLIPEPGVLALLGIGLAGLGALRRRRELAA